MPEPSLQNSSTPPRPAAFAELPPEVDKVMAIAMCKTPALRFSKAAEFANALRDATNGQLDDENLRRAKAILAKTPWNRLTEFGVTARNSSQRITNR